MTAFFSWLFGVVAKIVTFIWVDAGGREVVRTAANQAMHEALAA